jgi:universal stress protein A
MLSVDRAWGWLGYCVNHYKVLLIVLPEALFRVRPALRFVMAKIFDKILCPVAFDRHSAAAIRFACELAEPETSTLYLLHVVSAPTMETIIIEPHPIVTEAIAGRELEKIAQQHLPANFPYRIVLRSGDPATLIVAVAEELPADIIVMPTHGNRGVVGLIIGSVAERVVREAKRPVLTIQPGSHVSITTTTNPVTIPVRVKND